MSRPSDPKARSADLLRLYSKKIASVALLTREGRLRKSVRAEEVNSAVREAAEDPMIGVVEYPEVPLESSDIIGNPHLSVFDALSTRVQDDGYVKVVSRDDNEWAIRAGSST